MKVFSNKPSIKKSVILAERKSAQFDPLANGCPTWTFPILNKPLIEYTLHFLKKNGIEEIIISLPEEEKPFGPLGQSPFTEMNIKYHKEDRPRGTAGALKNLEKYLGQEPFLVIDSTLFPGEIDLAQFIRFHSETGSALSIGVYKENRRNRTEEIIRINKDKTVRNFHIAYYPIDKTSLLRPSGIYCLNPSVFRLIDQKNYMDIKEQLIPALNKEGLKISAYEFEGFHLRLNNMNDYMDVHRALLSKNNFKDFVDLKEIAKGVWVEKNVQISPQAYLLGPMVIGEDCKIEEGAQIIGPTVIGNRCQISEGVLVRESIIWDDVSLDPHSKVEYSVIGDHSNISGHVGNKNTIVLNRLSAERANLIHSDYTMNGILDLSGLISIASFKQKIYQIAKRTMDLVLSSIGIVLLLPLFLPIALLIKIESRGPVLYFQRRCGKDGKWFNMIKFRTMHANAEQLQKEYFSQKETDGPMFKILNDPRVTKLGRLFRSTSIDELPQLFNVLRGEMSLVGPRPLIMDEMKFSPSWREMRLSVKPGVTGLWQVEARRTCSFQDWIKYDVDYVKNRSLWLDIKILFKTIKVVLKREGAY